MIIVRRDATFEESRDWVRLAQAKARVKAQENGKFTLAIASGANYRDPANRSYWHMRDRCSNPAHPHYARYGGRGIRVCERWMSYDNFLADMGPRPPGKTLDRINVHGNYEPGNCRWATPKEQAHNRASKGLVALDGQHKTVADWCRHFGLSHSVVTQRVRRGMPLEQALKTPRMKPYGTGKKRKLLWKVAMGI